MIFHLKISAMQTIQSSLLPIQLRVKGTTPWLTLVCLENYNVPVATTVTETDTFCGNAVGLGVKKFTPAGSAVCEQFPTSDQVTYDTLLNWQMNNTLLEFRVEFPSSGGSIGVMVFLQGDCFVTSTEFQAAINDVIKFTYTLTGSGVLDNTAP